MRCRFVYLTHLIMLIKVDKHSTGDHGELNKVPTSLQSRTPPPPPAALCAMNFVHFRQRCTAWPAKPGAKKKQWSIVNGRYSEKGCKINGRKTRSA